MTGIDAEFIAGQLAAAGYPCKQSPSGWWRGPCPVHGGHGDPFAFKDLRGGVYVHCFSVHCDGAALEARLRELEVLPEPLACTLANYAEMLQVPEETLRQWGLTDSKKGARLAGVVIPYYDGSGECRANRVRIALRGRDRFRWRSGAKPCLYGLNLLDNTRDDVIFVEGESDCHCLWFEGFNAVGLPGAKNWNEARDAEHFDGFKRIYIIVEPDQGGDGVLAWIRRSRIRDLVYLVRMPDGFKDPADLYRDNQGEFATRMEKALADATAWTAYAANSNIEAKTEAKEKTGDLLDCKDIPAEAARQCHRLGVVGEDRLIKLIYLTATSRIRDRIVSLVIKGPSSSGKSFLVAITLQLLPDDAYLARSSMSERALVYSEEELSHKHLVIFEAAGIDKRFLNYIIRSLLSEGRLVYETVEKGPDGRMRARKIEREGPTGMILTTTELAIHPENETRMLSVTVNDTSEQTKAVLKRIAEGARDRIDLSRWHALGRYLAFGGTDVVVPYAVKLAEMIEPRAVRLRRDFATVLVLVETNALLHQHSRERDEAGRVIASLEDYATVRDLVNDLISESVEATVPKRVREVHSMVGDLLKPGAGGRLLGDIRKTSVVEHEADGTAWVRVRTIAATLDIERVTAWRAVREAIRRGYLRNLAEGRQGVAARITLGDPIPEEAPLLPERDALEEACQRSNAAKPPGNVRIQRPRR